MDAKSSSFERRAARGAPVAVRERGESGAQHLVLETEPEDGERAGRDELGTLPGKILRAEDDDRRMLGKRLERRGGVLPEENALEKEKIVVAFGDLLAGGLEALSDFRLDPPPREKGRHAVADSGFVDSQTDSDHSYRF